MTTTDMVSSEDGVSIITENAMAAVEYYLKQSKAESIAASLKKKVLIVDDSDFMLTMMQKLLANDYEVLTATSGLSAIRSITLNRPDLVLLDYEMPVCKGNQVLEMIRAEEDFADIPIIFLTSKVDRESVKKVIGLKPNGYLSKSLAPELIKKEVDNFFEKKTVQLFWEVFHDFNFVVEDLPLLQRLQWFCDKLCFRDRFILIVNAEGNGAKNEPGLFPNKIEYERCCRAVVRLAWQGV